MSDEVKDTPDIQRPPYWLYVIGRALVWVFFTIVGRFRAEGREHVPREGGVILAPNHNSYCDPPLVGLGAGRPLRYLAKAELFRHRTFGALIRAVGAYEVHRGTTDRAALRTTLALLAAGEAVIIFPEGTRSHDGRLQPPELGMALLALKARAPVVPVAVIGSDRLLPRGGKRLHFTRVKVIYGAPLDFSRYWALQGVTPSRGALREVSETTMRAIADLLVANGAADRVPPGYLAPPAATAPDTGA